MPQRLGFVQRETSEDKAVPYSTLYQFSRTFPSVYRANVSFIKEILLRHQPVYYLMIFLKICLAGFLVSCSRFSAKNLAF